MKTNNEKAGKKMKKEKMKKLYISISALMAFVLWTATICFIDVKSIGPKGSSVGFATVNSLVHKLTGVHMSLYHITDWLGLVPIFVAMCFGLLGLFQWIKRKKLRRVDYSIFILGGFYIAVISVYVLFEFVTVNYRPVLINGILETSYPSSTTLLVTTVMPTAIMQLKSRIKHSKTKKWLVFAIRFFVAFMVIARLISGVHWVTDIIGGLLLSVAMVTMYSYIINLKH